MAILELKNVKKSYHIGRQSQLVLKGIDLSFNKGEFVSILGESGCGKSTLMNLIGGLDSSFEGDIIVDGKKIKKFGMRELDDYRKDKVGFIFQSFNLVPHLSALDNVELAMAMSNMKRRERRKKAEDLLKKLGLEDHIYKKPNQLSGGQKQRVAIARALANDPDIILADEPTGSLDSATSEQILEIMQEIAREGRLVIAVTHSSRVASVGTRIVKMTDGLIINDQETRKPIIHEEKEQKAKLKSLQFLEAIKLAINNVRLNIKRNILVSLGTSIGIFSVVLMLSLGSGVENFIKSEIESALDPLTIEVTKASKNNDENNLDITRGFKQSDIDYLSNIKGVKSFTNIVSYMMRVSVVFDNKSHVSTIFSTMDETIKEDDILYGSLPEEGIIINKYMAESLTKEDIKLLIGKESMIQIPVKKDDGTMTYLNKKVLIDGIFESNDIYGNATLCYIKYNDLNSIYEENQINLEPTSIKLNADKESLVSGIKDEIKEHGYEGSREEELLKQVTNYLNIAIIILTGIAGISLLVSGIMILTVLYISVVERTREIGILRAIGARKKDIRHIFFFESALLGLMGGTFGITIAFIITIIGNKIFVRLYDNPFINLTLMYVLFGIIVSTIVSIIAGLMPSNKAANLDPVESLRHE